MAAISDDRQETLRSAERGYMGGRFDQAGTLFSHLARTQPDDRRIRLRLGQLALFENRLDAAIDLLMPCAEFDATAQLLAEAFYRARRFPEAAEWFARLGQHSVAAHLRAFDAREPCRVCGGPAETAVEFLTREPLPLLRVQINEREEALFVFDTGAWDTVIDAASARRLGVPRGWTDSVGCADGGSARVEYTRVNGVGIGAMAVADVPVQVMDLGQALAGFFEPHGVDGVLGLGVLSRFGLTLDVQAGGLRLSRGLRMPDTATPCWLGSGRQLLVWGEINRRPNFWFLDTGMTGYDCLLPASTAMHAALDLDPSRMATGYGGGGRVTLATTEIADLQLGAMNKAPATGVVAPGFPLERCYGFRIGGLLAFEFFKHAILRIDFASMRLAVQAASVTV